MHIELVTRTAASEPHPVELLFIHGGFHGAWCWDEYFLPWFAARGWTVHALSLRGHAGSDGADRITDWMIADYVDDVETVLAQIDAPVALVGHSLGGVVAQKCWENIPQLAGMVLMASSPLRPSPSVILRLFRKRPFAMLMGQLMGNPRMLMRALEPMLFSPTLSDEKKEAYKQKLCPESPKAIKEVFGRDPITPRPDDTRPVLVIGGADDWSIPHSANEELAKTYGAPLKICSGAHDLMLDPTWEDSAQGIEEWLSGEFAK